MERKKPENVVPQPFGKLFSSFDYFNEMQSALLDDLLHTDKSLVLSAPTGSGKTVAFELAIVRMLQKTKSQQDQNASKQMLPKAVYIAPIKALCSEKFNDWKPRFHLVNVSCMQITGDSELLNTTGIEQSQVIITTPEKWDSMTRHWRHFKQLLHAVQLFIVDEVHLLNEDSRGPVLETIVVRMKSCGVERFILASATIPNAEDLTSWLHDGNGGVPTVKYVFNAKQRPVPLEKHVVGFNSKLKGFQFDMRLNYQLPEILRKYAEDKASLVFCSSRKSAEMAAFNLYKSTPVFVLNENQKLYLSQLASSIADVKMRKLVESGIAYHHAGVQHSDRGLIESSFRQGFLMVLICTSTLAMGINLPARLVVIKSTEIYRCSGYTEYPENMILQMIGRAGRPQYDTKGVAVILTQQKNVQKYEKLLNGTTPIESQLHKHLTELLNSEIALNTITSLEVAMFWVRSTFLYIRAVRNPKHYGFNANLTKDFVEHKLEELCFRQINALQEAGLAKFDVLTGTDVKTTEYGKLMTKYYLCFETMKLFQQLDGNESLEDLLKLLVHCKEMSEFMLRVNEKKVLNEINKTPIRFRVKGRIKNHVEKISCIIQAVLGNIEISAPGLIQESIKIMRIGSRVSKCLLEYVRLRISYAEQDKNEVHCNWYSTMLNAITLAKCLHVQLWEDSEFAAKQLRGIGTVYTSVLARFGLTSLKAIAKTEARTIEKILNKSAPFGDEVLVHLMGFPEYNLKLERKSDCFAQIYVQQVNERYVHKDGASAVLILGDSLNNLLLIEENINDIINEYGSYERLVKLVQTNEVEYVYGHVIHVSLVGVDTMSTLEINPPKNVGGVEGNDGGKVNTKPKKKQSLLNFTLNDIDFEKTTLSFDDTLGKDFQQILNSKITITQQNMNSNFDKENIGNIVNRCSIYKDDCDFNKTVTDLENFRFKKPSISSILKTSFGEETFNKMKNDDTFESISNITTSVSDLNATSKSNRVKQSKLTEFFNKCKIIDNNFTKSHKTCDIKTSKSSLKRMNVVNEEKNETNEETVTQAKQTKISPQVKSPITSMNKNNKNSKNRSGSTYSSSDDIPCTIIPNPNKTKLSNSALSESSGNAIASKQRSSQNLVQRSPLTLASFLADPKELNKSDPMIKLPEESIPITKATHSSLSGNSNELKKDDLSKPTQRSEASKYSSFEEEEHNIIDLTTQTSNRGCKECKSAVTHDTTNQLNFEKPISNDAQLSRHQIVNKNSYGKRQRFLELKDFSRDETKKNPQLISETKKDAKNVVHSLLAKPNLPVFEITAKYESNNFRKRFNDNSKPENSFRKLLREDSLLQSKHSDSLNTQNCPLDLSRTADLKNKSKLYIKNSTKSENKATQTDFVDTSNQTPTQNDFKLWHKVALQFSKVSLVQAQSLTNFQSVYNTVRQQQQHNGNTLSHYLFSDRNQNSSNFKMQQHSTFRLQLFEDKNKTKECCKLNRQEIKLINQNVMSLVLEKKCKENALQQAEGDMLDHKEHEAGTELDKLEQALDAMNSNDND